jgi:hypothetical protein
MRIYFTILLLAIGNILAIAQNNIVKWNLSALSLVNFSLQYEHVLGPKSTVALGLSMLPSLGVPATITDKTGNEDLASLSISGWAITPEYRYYCSGEAPKGFYFAPYLRISKYSIDDLNISYTSNGIAKHTLISGAVKSTMFGLMIGKQWRKGDHWVIDWWIVGAAIGSRKATATGTGNFSVEDQASITDKSNTIDIPGDFKITTTATQVDVTYDIPYPAIRGFGFCVGYRF